MPTSSSRAARVAALIIVALTCGSCTVGPDYRPPEPVLPAQWNAQPAGALPQPADLRRWWALLGDPVLDALVDEAVRGNLPLREAVARVEESRARYRVARAALFPELDAEAVATRNRTSQNGLFLGGEEYSDFAVGVAASWELDVFGRVRRAVESATALVEASEEDQRTVLVVLCAEVAQAYVTLRTLQQRLAVAQANLASQEEIFRLTSTRLELGLASGLDVAQAAQVLASTRTLVPPLELALTETINRLDVLLGQQPGTLRARLIAPAPIPQPPDAIATGVPADLLRQRPDIRRAERELAAATARIGVAVGDLYPRFSLLGTLALNSTQIADLFEGSSRAYGVGPSMVWNLFDAGRLRAFVDAEEAATAQALARYEQQLLVALQEVENALAAWERSREERGAVADAVAASREALDLATLLYTDGAVDFQNVLDAQRTLLELQERQALTDGNVVRSVVRLYLALGGGWDPAALDPDSDAALAALPAAAAPSRSP